MSKFLGLAAAAAATLFAAQASAATVTQSFFTGTPPNTTGPAAPQALPFTNTVNVANFDASLGTLNSVTISVNGSVIVTARVTNVGPQAGSGPTSPQPFSDVSVAAPFTLTANGSTTLLNTLVTSTPFSGTAPVGVFPATRVLGPATSNSVSGSAVLGNALFTGTGTTALALAARTGAFTPDGSITSETDVGGFASASLTIVVTYDFTAPVVTPPTGVPEPASLALLGLGLAAVGVIRRRV